MNIFQYMTITFIIVFSLVAIWAFFDWLFYTTKVPGCFGSDELTKVCEECPYRIPCDSAKVKK